MKKKIKYPSNDILGKIVENYDPETTIYFIPDCRYQFYVNGLKVVVWWYMFAHIEVEGIALDVDRKKTKPLWEVVTKQYKNQFKIAHKQKMSEIRKALEL